MLTNEGGLPLIWIEIRLRDGTVCPIAEVDLPDRASYHGGYKPGILLDVSELTRALSDARGEPETTAVSFTIMDRDGDWRARAASSDPDVSDFSSLPVTLCLIDDADRRLEAAPLVAWRGSIRQVSWIGDLALRVTCEDLLERLLADSPGNGPIPKASIELEDFPNAALDHVAPSATGYRVDGALDNQASSCNVRNGTGVFAPGATFSFAGVGEYSVQWGSGHDPETALKFSPNTGMSVADGTEIRFYDDHRITPAVGLPVPFGYGVISDYAIIDGSDWGDGQGPGLYVGDRVLADGHTWAEILWLGHPCYSPSGGPFQSVYFWNSIPKAVQHFYISGQGYAVGSLAAETAAGGRLCLPGTPNWAYCGLDPAKTYVTYNGHDYTVCYLRSLFRDWALGIMGAPQNLGGVPFTINGYGWAASDGSLLRAAGQIYEHITNNYLLHSYRGGPAYTTIDPFPDDPTLPLLDALSFDACDYVANLRVPGGCVLDFILGAKGQRITRHELIQKLNTNFDVRSGVNEALQYVIVMEIDDPTIALSEIETLEDVLDLLHEGNLELTWEDHDDRLVNTIRYVHTADYIGREPSGWRSALTGVFEASDLASVDRHGVVYDSQDLELGLIRGKNRGSDPDLYAQGSAWVADLLARRLRRTAQAPRVYTVATGLRGLNPGFTLGKDCYVSAGTNLGGRTPRPITIERVTARPGAAGNGRVVVLTGTDQTRILDPTRAIPRRAPASTSAYVPVRTPSESEASV